ncbi:protein dispatched homolog 2 [Tachyglossus aculeatus]|uniref:protein dispatched homolog 2 n=1 Tax=Tachyglossus aculeatus TaxID=9261 RepID=UPI0018F7C5E3|nr:protein dispatched homolog 2 [Tachyglossus aculeatus]
MDRFQLEALVPELGQEWSCPLHRCPLSLPPSGPDRSPRPQVQSSPRAPDPPRLSYLQAHQECRGLFAPGGPGDRAALCSHRSSLSPSPVPSQQDTSWKGQPLQRHVVSVGHERAFRMPRSYSQLIAEWPLAVLLLCLATVLLCTLAGLLGGLLPDFSQPLLGFEPRGTDIGRKLAVWRTVEGHTGPQKALLLAPDPEQNSSHSNFTGSSIDGEEPGWTQRMVDPVEGREQDGFFCGPPGKSYSQLVFMSTTAGSLWNLPAVQSMCRLEEDKIRSHARFGELCQRTAANACCPSWSLGNYIAELHNRSSCLAVTQGDLARTLALLRACAPDYHRGALAPACLGPGRSRHPRCARLAERCARDGGTVYQLLHFLVDRDFLSPQTAGYRVPSLKYSLLFLPTQKGPSMMGIYLDALASPQGLSDNFTTVTGMDLGLKEQLFRHYLARDLVYPLLAVGTIFLSVALYLRSLFVTLMALLVVVGSLLVSFFLYRVAFRLAYFPVANLAAVVLLSPVCANHSLVFCDLWRLSRGQLPPAAGLVQRVGRTLRPFSYLLLLSGLTSSAAFFASSLSHLAAVRCFAVYMGTAVLVSLALALTWLPSAMVLYERYLAPGCATREARGGRGARRLVPALALPRRALAGASHLLFQRLLPCGVIKFRYIWVGWFAALAAGGAYMACFSPRLRLPTLTLPGSQLFRPGHPFERFDAEYRQQFGFERLPRGEGGPMPVALVWGVLPVDTADPLDPRGRGALVRDPAFAAGDPQAQRWLLGLCHRARNQSFFRAEPEGLPSVCFVEELRRWLDSRPCPTPEPCCGPGRFPLAPSLFLHCLRLMARERAQDLGLRFDASGGLAALVLQFHTTFCYSANYTRTQRFYRAVSRWLRDELATAPQGLRNGWMTGRLEVYSLQLSLSTEPGAVLGLALALAFATLLLGTWNLPLSLFSVTAIAGTVLVTAGLLVLLEWQLNAAESLFLSAAAGLSVDLTVNYCASYHLCPQPDRLSRVAFSLRHLSRATAVGASALFPAGVFMLPSTVLLYRQLGIFLLTVRCVSCGFASFFFQSLCCFFGPERGCGPVLGSRAPFPRPSAAEEPRGRGPGPRPRSASLDTSTDTSKLSQRPSVLSEELADGPWGARPPALHTSSPAARRPSAPPAETPDPPPTLPPPQAAPPTPPPLLRKTPLPRPSQKAPPPPPPPPPLLQGAPLPLPSQNPSTAPSPSPEDPSPENPTAGPPAPERGQLNGQRGGLRLALRETVYDPSGSSRRARGAAAGEGPVVLPNSQPDLPDVWLPRTSSPPAGYGGPSEDGLGIDRRPEPGV